MWWRCISQECDQRQSAPGAEEAKINPRIRKLIGTVALLSLVAVWSLLAMAFAQVVLVRQNGLIEFAYYAVAGLGWVLPAMPLISWMAHDRKAG